MGQTIQVAGSLLILIPFVLGQFGRLAPTSPVYVASNLVGSLILAVEAALGRQWGFLLLEGVWAAVSAWALVAMIAARAKPAQTDVQVQYSDAD
jgi:hypothetical protein